MRRNHVLTAVLLAALFVLCAAACACAAEIRPIPVDHDKLDLTNGEFCFRVTNANRIEDSGYFIAALYLEDRYDGAQIRALAPGDRVWVNDRAWTVQEVVPHTEEDDPETCVYEIYTEEENYGYIAFEPRKDGTFNAIEDDWVPVTPVGSVKAMLPFPDAFEFIRISAGEEQAPEDTQAFLDYLAEYGQDDFTAYNSTCTFKDGALVRVLHSSYPQGPEEDSTQPVPVWKFCHGLRDGLDTAVITAYTSDCEEGPIPAEITAEEAEQIRRLAMNGVVTEKASDEMVTGGTWIYTFETPGGKHLLTVEMYRGQIVGSGGMYSYK